MAAEEEKFRSCQWPYSSPLQEPQREAEDERQEQAAGVLEALVQTVLTLACTPVLPEVACSFLASHKDTPVHSIMSLHSPRLRSRFLSLANKSLS